MDYDNTEGEISMGTLGGMNWFKLTEVEWQSLLDRQWQISGIKQRNIFSKPRNDIRCLRLCLIDFYRNNLC